jgi:hypothetical protein
MITGVANKQVAIQEPPLQVIVRESGLEATKAQVILTKFTNFFELAAEWELKAKALIVRDEKDVAGMQQAREGRLMLKAKRIDIENTRKTLKEQSLREGKAIDGIANILKGLIVPIEEHLERQEKYAETKAAELYALRVRERSALMESFPLVVTDLTVLGRMDDATWDVYFTGICKQEEDRIAAEQKAEDERMEREKREAVEREQIRQENERLKAEAAERDKAIAAERAKAEKERKAQEAKLKAEREARECAEAELAVIAEAEKDEQRRRKAEERKAKMAPDRDTLIALTERIKGVLDTAPVFTDPAVKLIADRVRSGLESLVYATLESVKRLGE